MNEKPDQADLWLAENDPLHYLSQVARDSSEDVLNLEMSDHFHEGFAILEERNKVTNVLAN